MATEILKVRLSDWLTDLHTGGLDLRTAPYRAKLMEMVRERKSECLKDTDTYRQMVRIENAIDDGTITEEQAEVAWLIDDLSDLV
jgi:hypothetical protein